MVKPSKVQSARRASTKFKMEWSLKIPDSVDIHFVPAGTVLYVGHGS
jgi:hypothetical protein